MLTGNEISSGGESALMVHNSVRSFCLSVTFFYWAGFLVIPHMYLACFSFYSKKKESALTFLDTFPC